MIAENNYEYKEMANPVLTGWYKVCITKITEPTETHSGNATGFWIQMDVWVDDRTLQRSVWLSFDHPSDFVTRKSTNICAMLRQMFPAVTNDAGYIDKLFWLLFKTYEDKNGKEKEQFFDSKHHVSLDGKTTLYGDVIEEENEQPRRMREKVYSNGNGATDNDGSDVPF